MECSFKAGDRVVCVDDMTNDGIDKLPEIDKGRIYVVSRVGLDIIEGLSEVGVWLEGIHREHYAFIDCGLVKVSGFGFRPSRFRPLVTRKTDISIFTDMLHTQRTGVPA